MTLKILQWNILRKEDPDHIVQFIKQTNPDIVVAQELIENTEKKIDTAKYISNKLGFNYFFKEADTWSPAKNNKTSQGNVIFSRFPITESKFSQLTKPYHNPPDANYEGRVYVEITTKINNKLLSIGTTHLAFSPKFVITKKREKEVDNLIDVIKSKKSAFIFSGDLNSPPNSYTIKQIQKYLAHAGPDYSQPTWTTKPFDYHGQFKEDKLCWRLDYIFTTKDIKIIKSQIIKTDYSDHLPILLTLNL